MYYSDDKKMMNSSSNQRTHNGVRLEPKLLLQRYKFNNRTLFNRYASFCNAIQFPGLINISGHYCSVGRTPNLDEHWRPSIFDYFGYCMTSLQEVSTDPNSRLNNFDILSPIGDGGRGIAIFNDRKPPFFFIESRLVIESQSNDIDGNMNATYSSEEHFVAVIHKNDKYYICPGEENSLIYRVDCPEKVFFTQEGHGILALILRRSFENNCAVHNMCLLVPKRSMCQTINEVGNWDRTSVYEIEVHLPFPVVETSTIPAHNHSSVQIIRLDDRSIVNIVTDDNGAMMDGSSGSDSDEE